MNTHTHTHTHTHNKKHPPSKINEEEKKNIAYDVENTYSAGIASEVNPNTYPF